MMKGIMEFLYGPRKMCSEADRVVCPSCGCRTDFRDIVEFRGIIACQRCVRENS